MSRLRRCRLRPRHIVMMALVVGLAACGSPRRGEPIGEPLELSSETLLRGKTAYDRHCLHCHGNGEGAMAPALNDKPLPKPLMRLQIRVGLGAMPSFSEDELSDGDVDAIVDYLVALRKHGQ